MNRIPTIQPWILLIFGLALLGAGFFIIPDSLKTISGLCIGIGAGLAGVNLANLWGEHYYRQNPHLIRQSEIAARDERNQLIMQKSKARAYDVLVRILMLIPFLLILVGAPLWVTLAVVAINLAGFGLQMYFTVQYNKEL